MNFLGHVIAARWDDDDPRHGLGAMLPDLARMSGSPTPRTSDPAIARGVRQHHRIDAIFHDVPSFLALMQEGRARLSALGVARPAALAAAHVGVELLLDGAWSRDAEHMAAFVSATRAGQDLPAHALDWTPPQAADRFADLLTVLPSLAQGYASAVTVADRLLRILARRPRLAPVPRDADAIRSWVAASASVVWTQADAVLDELRRAVL